MGRTLRRAQEHLALALAGAVLCGVALLPLVAVVAKASPSALKPLASATPWLLLLRSCALAAAVTACTLGIGVPLGVLLGRADVPGRRAALLLHALPAFLPPFLLAVGWFNLPHGDALFSSAGAIGVETAAFAPIVTILVAFGVQAIDPSLEEAGRLCAPPWKVALRIVLPAAWPAAALGALLVFALSLSELGVPIFLRIRAYPAAVFARLGAIDYAPGEAAVLALPLLAVAAALLLVERRIGARRSFAVLGLRSEERPRLALGRYRPAATLACWLAATASVVPLAGLLLRALRDSGFAQLEFGTSVWNSVAPAAIAASALTAVGIVLGRAVARGRHGAIPARAFAVAVAQGSPHLEEAAAVQGASFLRRMRRIVIPLHRRAIAGAWLLAFVFCLRDLETVVLFYPPGKAPLTVRILTMEANGAPGVVAALSLVQCGIVAVAVAAGALILPKRRR